MDERPVLTTKRAAADQLSISLRHLENLIKRERLPVVRLGRSVRLPVDVVNDLARRGA